MITIPVLLIRWADVVAIPLFLLAVIYFWQIPHKTAVEWILLVFSVGGLVLDFAFTMSFLTCSNHR